MHSRRMDGAGNPVSSDTYIEELNTYKRWKKESVSGMRANPWSQAERQVYGVRDDGRVCDCAGAGDLCEWVGYLAVDIGGVISI